MTLVSNLISSRQAGWSLAQAFYVDPVVFQRDMDRVFRSSWLFAGHACQIQKAGEYFCYEIGHDSLIIIRGTDGRIRALFNVCCHHVWNGYLEWLTALILVNRYTDTFSFA